ncbi:MAG: T9SS type A sorting domain-containing protein [Paludibacter sp.]
MSNSTTFSTTTVSKRNKFSSGFKFLSILLLVLLVSGKSWGQTTQTWTGTTNSTWLTSTNWSTAVPGNKTTTTNNDIAYFNNTTQPSVGINMNTQGGSQYLGALNFGASATTARTVSNSSSTVSGTMYFNGVNLNAVSNTIIWNQSSASHTFTNGSNTLNLGLNATDHVIQITGTGGITIASVITGVSKNLEKAGSGTGVLTLSGVNTYSGTTTVTAGELRLNPSANLSMSGACTFNGGTLSTTGIASTRTITFGSINIADNSILALLASTNHTVTFTNKGTFTAGKTLTITGWTGSYILGTTGAVTAAGKVFIGSTASLTTGELAQIRFYNGTNYYSATQLSTGEIIPTTALVVSTVGNQTAGVGFSVTVTAKDLDGNARALTNATGITLSTTTGGTIGGTTTGTINAATSAVTISGVTLTAGTAQTITATRSSGDKPNAGTSAAFDVTASGSTPTKLVISSISPTTPTSGGTFNVTVQAQDGSNLVSNVTSGTDISLSLASGTGTLGGTTTGTITNGSSSVTITGVTYNVGETGVSLTAAITAGMSLTSATSGTFTVFASTPTVASAVNSPSKTGSSIGLSWTNGNGSARIVVARLNATSAVAPTNGVAYTANSTSFSDGANSTTGTENRVVYNGTGNSVTVTGLTAVTAYNFDVYEYNGSTSTYNYAAAASLGSTTTLAAEPTAQPTSITFTSVTTTGMTIGWTSGNGSNRIVVVKAASAVNSDPVDGTTYTANVVFGSGTQIGTGNYVVYNSTGTSVAVTGLTSNTTYNVAVYEFNGSTTTINYLTTSPLTGSKITLPTAASSVSVTARTATTMDLSWTSGTGTGRIVVARPSTATLVAAAAGTSYTVNSNSYSDVTNANTGAGNVVVYNGTGNTTTVTGLSPAVQYTYYVYEYNSATVYATAATSSATYTLSAEPTTQSSAVTILSALATGITINFTKGDGASRVVLVKSGSAVDGVPVDATSYTTAAFGSGTLIGTGNYVVYSGTAGSVSVTGLTANTTYYIAVFEFNGSGTTINYLTTTPLTGNKITLVAAPSAPTNLTFGSVTYNSFTSSFTAPGTAPAGYLVLRRSGTTVSGTPVGGTVYTQGQTNIGSGTNDVVYVGTSAWTAYTQSTLTDNTTYYYAVYSYDGTGTQTNYSAALTGSQLTSSISAPTANAATNISSTGFTANWDALAGATGGYLLDVSTSSNFGTSSPATLTEGFETGLSGSYITSGTATLGSGVWSFTYGGLDVTGTGNFNSGTHGCQLKASTGVATAPSKSNVSTVTFYVKSPNGASTLDVKKIVNGGSPVLVETKNITSAWAQYTVAVNETSSDVQISFVNGASYVLIDDVSIGYTTVVPSFVTGFNAKPITGQSTVSADVTTGLSANTAYYYRVRSVGGNSTSANSGTVTVTTKSTSSVTLNGTTSFTYTASAQTPAFTVTGSDGALSYIYAGTGATTYSSISAPTSAGTYTVTASVAANTGYDAASSSATAFTIAKASLSITSPAAVSKPYDGNNTATITGTLNGVMGGDDVSLVGTGTFDGTGVANGIAVTSTSTLTGAKAANYSLTQPTGLTANITAIATDAVTGSIGTSALLQGTDLTIKNGILLTVDNASTTVHSITVNPGGQLTLASGKTLNVGTLTLQSSASGTATFVDNGGTLNSTATHVEQWLTTGRNWYISSPVASAPSNVVSPSVTYPLYWYKESLGSTYPWIQITNSDSTFNVLKGYVTNVETEGVVTFSGTLNTGEKSITLRRTTGQTKEGFNLVGNPYASYLDWDQVSKTNLLTSIWYRSKNNIIDPKTGKTSYVFDTYNSVGLIGTGNNGAYVNSHIPPMQSFWVRVQGASQATLTVDNTMRSHKGSQDNGLSVVNDGIFKSKSSVTKSVLRLQVSNGTNTDEAVIYSNPGASNSFDNYDSPKMFNNTASIAEIYTVAGNEQLAINGLNTIPYDTEMNLGFSTVTAGTYSLKASQFSNFESGVRVILKDYLDKNNSVTTDLSDGTTSYSFTSEATTNTSRFTLVFKAPSVATGINSGYVGNVWLSTNANGQILINGVANAGTTMSVYNAIGQRLASKNMTSNINVLDNKLVPGVYTVTLTNAGKSSTTKIVVK